MSTRGFVNDFLQKRRTQRALTQTQKQSTFARQTFCQPQPQIPNEHLVAVQFANSKRQCLQELQKIKYNISQEEGYIVRWMDSYEIKLFQMMDVQMEKIKRQIMDSIDKGYLQNKRILKQNFQNYGVKHRLDIENVRLELRSLRQRVDQLQRQLQSSDYRRGIIDTVSNNFQTECDIMLQKLADSLCNFQESVYLKVNADILGRVKLQVTQLFFIDEIQLASIQNQPIPKGDFIGSSPVLQTLGNVLRAQYSPGPIGASRTLPQVGPNMQNCQIGYQHSAAPGQQMAYIGSNNRFDGRGQLTTSGPYTDKPPIIVRPNLHLNRDIIQGSGNI